MDQIERSCRYHTRTILPFPAPPDAWFERVAAFGAARPGQRVLDLGAGSGAVAIPLARRGCRVTALDRDGGAIAAAQEMASREGLEIVYVEAPAEDTGLADASFDAILAHRSWCYFDACRAIREVQRLLAPHGVFVLSQCAWQPQLDPLAKALEEILARFQEWRDGREGPQDFPYRAEVLPYFRYAAAFRSFEPIEFAHEALCSCLRSCPRIAGALPPVALDLLCDEVRSFLANHAPDPVSILHAFEAEFYDCRSGRAGLRSGEPGSRRGLPEETRCPKVTC